MSSMKKSLTDREYYILQRRFGLFDVEPGTLEEIGKELSVTRERVRQIESRALRKMRNSKNRYLKSYLD